MNSKKVTASVLFSFFFFAACGGPKNTEQAAQAMERARAAEAPQYAPQEFENAGDLYRKMTAAVENKQNKEASSYADQTVAAANAAAARARENKATLLIGNLASLLNTAQKQGLPKSNGQVYNQAAQAHIDASAFRDAKDYEKAIQSAESGINILKPVLKQAYEEARQLLEKARSRYNEVSSSAGADMRGRLNEAAAEIKMAASAYESDDLYTSKEHSQKALDILSEISALAGEGGRRAIGQDSLQLQAYQLIRQLGQTVDYLKKNGYTNDVTLSAAMMEDTNTTHYITNSTADLTNAPADEEIFILMEEEGPVQTADEENVLSYMPILLRAQAGNPEVITFAMIEEKYTEADAYYKEGNYISAIDSAREGLRLAELYLSAQTMAMHTVIKGDTLWDISGKYYKRNFFLWPNIWNANKLQIKDPDLIYPKQVFRIPPAPIPAK